MSKRKTFWMRHMDALFVLDELSRFATNTEEFYLSEESKQKDEQKVSLEEILNAPLRNIGHSAVVITLSILIEQQLKTLASEVRRSGGLDLPMSDIRGSTIERFEKYCRTIAKMTVLPQPTDWNEINGIWELRNCLVHYAQDFNAFQRERPRQATALESFHARHGVPELGDNGRVYVNIETSKKTIELTREFFEKIYEALFQQYPNDF